MSDPHFDTLRTTRNLEAAGIEPAHAEAITVALRDAVTGGVATKADIARLEDKMGNLEDKMENYVTKADLYRALWIQSGAMIAAMTALAGAAFALAELLGRGG